MTLRDRLVVTVIAVLVVLGACWVLVVSPERKKANGLSSQVATAKSSLATAEAKLNTARAAQARYASAYAEIVSLGKAVPTTQEIPSLIYQLSAASKQKSVVFESIGIGSGGSSASSTSTSSSSSSSSSSSATANAAAAGFEQVPFTFSFSGSYASLESMLGKLTDLATMNSSGQLEVSGRLLTIGSLKLSPDTSGTNGSRGLSASITATAYQLPAEAASASSSTSSTATTPTVGAPSSTTAPAIVKVK